jgi:hypothetical protein
LSTDIEAPDNIVPAGGFRITFCLVLDGFLEFDGAGKLRGSVYKHLVN